MKTTTPRTDFTVSQPSSSRKQLSAFDVLFIGLIGLCLAAGIQLSRVNNRPSPFGISVLFGSAISLLTYYFLGGIKQDEATVKAGLGNTTTITLGGSVAALVGSTLISNFILEKQMTEIALSHEPSQQNLVIVDHNGDLVEEFKISGIFSGVSANKTITVSPELAKEIREVCYQGKGFCQQKYQEVKFKIDGNLNQKFATVCQKNDELHGYPLMLSSGKKGSEMVRVTLVANKTCLGNEDPSLITISQGDAKLLKVNEQDLGWANIAPLITKVPEGFYKTSSR